MSEKRPFIVGLTGGIGSGKSTVADLFVEQGAALVDTDAIAHELTGPGGAAMPALIAAFGAQVVGPDGAMDRAAMRRLVFADPAAKGRLEGILHPMIRQLAAERCQAAAGALRDPGRALAGRIRHLSPALRPHRRRRLPGEPAGRARHGAQRHGPRRGARHHGGPGRRVPSVWLSPTMSVVNDGGAGKNCPDRSRAITPKVSTPFRRKS